MSRKPPEWNRERIIKEIKELEDKSDGYNYKNNGSLYTSAYKYFGSWKNAVETAGFDYDKIRKCQRWTKNKIIKEIKKLKNRTLDYSKKNNKPLFSAAHRHFGSWENAMEAAGFDYDKIRRCQQWNKDKIIINIKQLENKTSSYNRDYNDLLYKAARNYFGSWGKAVEAAGFNYYNEIKLVRAWSKKEIIKEIKKLENKTSRHTQANNLPLFRASRRHFGSWGQAVEASGFNYDKIKNSYKRENNVGKILKLIFSEYKILPQKTFPWLKYRRHMFIDRYIPHIRTAVEINGRQHYESVEYFGGETDFKLRQSRDKKKAKLLKKHKIRLVIIHYTEKITIENIKGILIESGVKL